MSEQLAMVQQESIVSRAADRVAAIGDRVVGAALDAAREHPVIAGTLISAAALFGGNVATASADTAPVSGGSTTITELNSDTFIVAGKSHMSENDFASVTVMTNDRTISKAKIKELQSEGDCEVFNGKKVDIHTEGHFEGGVADGRDTRTSLFCHDAEGWFRAACGNRAWINVPAPKPIENVIWASDKTRIKVVTRASATAEAECTTPDGLASAESYGHGSGFASAFLKIHTSTHANTKANANSTLISETELKAQARARSHAGAKAGATCIEKGGIVGPPPIVTPIPKNGTEGPGSNIPTQPGGTGSGGTGGNTGEGVPCYDDNSTTNGDQNPNTSGGIMYGTAADQLGICVGPAQPMENA